MPDTSTSRKGGAGPGLERPDRQAHPRALRHLHREQELDLPARLVEQVVDAVAGLGKGGAAVGEEWAPADAAELVQVEQGPDRDAAVDDIFPLVAGIVPSPRDVERVSAGRPAIAALVRPGDAGRAIRRMARRPRPALAAGVARFDRSARAAVIEIVQRVEGQARVEVGADPERAASRRADDEAEIVAGLPVGAEIDQMEVLARGGSSPITIVSPRARETPQRSFSSQWSGVAESFGSSARFGPSGRKPIWFRRIGLSRLGLRRGAGIGPKYRADEAAGDVGAEDGAVLVAAQWCQSPVPAA